MKIEKRDSRAEALGMLAKLTFTYLVVGMFWAVALGLEVKKGAITGAVVGGVVALLFAVPVILTQKTEEGVEDMKFASGAIWGAIALILIIVALITWGVRLLLV